MVRALTTSLLSDLLKSRQLLRQKQLLSLRLTSGSFLLLNIIKGRKAARVFGFQLTAENQILEQLYVP